MANLTGKEFLPLWPVNMLCSSVQCRISWAPQQQTTPRVTGSLLKWVFTWVLFACQFRNETAHNKIIVTSRHGVQNNHTKTQHAFSRLISSPKTWAPRIELKTPGFHSTPRLHLVHISPLYMGYDPTVAGTAFMLRCKCLPGLWQRQSN